MNVIARITYCEVLFQRSAALADGTRVIATNPLREWVDVIY